jgi:hypothetical protein
VYVKLVSYNPKHSHRHYYRNCWLINSTYLKSTVIVYFWCISSLYGYYRLIEQFTSYWHQIESEFSHDLHFLIVNSTEINLIKVVYFSKICCCESFYDPKCTSIFLVSSHLIGSCFRRVVIADRRQLQSSLHWNNFYAIWMHGEGHIKCIHAVCF